MKRTGKKRGVIKCENKGPYNQLQTGKLDHPENIIDLRIADYPFVDREK